MTIDELPIEWLFVIVCLGWAAYLIVIAEEWKRNRRHDRDARRARRRVCAECAEHGRPDHKEEREEEEAGAEHPTEEAEERCVIHGRIVQRASDVYIHECGYYHPGEACPFATPVPSSWRMHSVTERLDRWED